MLQRSMLMKPSSTSLESSGATLTVNAAEEDPAAVIRRETDGGAQGALVTAVSPKAFAQAVGMLGRGGTMSLV